MIKTSTSVNKVNYSQHNQEINPVENLEAQDLMFYDSIKPQLSSLTKTPSDETIDKILAYSRAK